MKNLYTHDQFTWYIYRDIILIVVITDGTRLSYVYYNKRIAHIAEWV